MALTGQLRHVVVLVGGVGGAKLAHGLAQILPPGALTVIVNTGDDFWHYGLRICPDLDTVMYTLGGLVDRGQGWGVAEDTFTTLDALRRLGDDPWFRLGDRDLATHLRRTQALQAGWTLTQITEHLCQMLGISQRILPMTDAPVATIIETTTEGALPFQEYFVKHRWQPPVRALRLEGLAQAALSEPVRAALMSADAILIGPSNPWLSIAPILLVPGLRDLLMGRAVPRVALSPIVEGRALKGPAAKLMVELGYEPSARAVAAYYGDLVNGFVYDERDAHLQIATPATATFDTIMHSDTDRQALARKILSWIESELV
ncbi:MAG: 2-phospho-L-lactate transferase [Chloroflexi bacterium]|nr:2-phospho-L-lactate transferase [Chloroflexota bacterium]